VEQQQEQRFSTAKFFPFQKKFGLSASATIATSVY
jgi:hypothetical protein